MTGSMVTRLLMALADCFGLWSWLRSTIVATTATSGDNG